MKISSQKVLNGLLKLEEEQLTNDVIRPLLEVIHPGRIEFTHSPLEAGRDLVSFGRDYLSRTHILCVQVKALKLSFGAAPFKDVINAAEVALRSKVTLEDGEMAFPSEVWVITSHPFPEQKRRQLVDFLNELSRKGIKVIAGDELADLLIKNNTDIATWLSKYSSTEIINFLSELSEHKEAKAFGFSANRNIEDFYITTTLSPYSINTTLAINNKFRLKNFNKKFSLPVRKLLQGQDFLQDDKKIINSCIQNISRIENGSYFRGVEVITNVKIEDSVQKIKEKFLVTFNLSKNNFIQSNDIFYQLKTRKKAIHKFIYKNLSSDLKRAVDKFKKVLGLDAAYSEMLALDLNKILLNPTFSNEDLIKDINLTEETRLLIEKITDTRYLIVKNRYILDELFSQNLIRTNESKVTEITGEIFFDLEATLKDLVGRSKVVIKDCPKKLDKNVIKIKDTIYNEPQKLNR